MEFSTFCVNDEQIKTAFSAGATHLILEDPAVSVRSFSNDVGSHERLAHLVRTARGLAPDILLSLNIDLLPHMTDLTLVQNYVRTARNNDIPRIRVQDPGLALLVKEEYPEAVCHLATETGNANLPSMESHHTYFQRQCFALDTALPDMKNAIERISGEFEIMVQGPILIQYSQRRFLKGLSDTVLTHGDVFAARDSEYPGRLYRFYDNPHGHFMYLYFDRCLLSCLDDLKPLSVQSWLIDGRGESLEYLTTAITAYRNAYTQITMETAEVIQHLKELTQRPQRPGFFRANLTDQERGIPKTQNDAQLGIVIDVIKEHSFTVLMTQTLTEGPFLAITPEGKKIPLKNREIRNLSGQPVTEGHVGQLLRFFWQKGICSNTVIVVNEATAETQNQ
jgi:collagenase-like PrtC family protease